MRKNGERRGPPPQEELDWLRAHLLCESLNQLYRDYSVRFNFPYYNITSFRAMMEKYKIRPISKALSLPNAERVWRLAAKGPIHWDFNHKPVHRAGRMARPHWLWRYHNEGYKQGSGAMFAPPPYPVKEMQFTYVEDLESGDPD